MMNSLPMLADVNTDAQNKGLADESGDRPHAVARLGLNQSEIDGTLNDLFGQRQVSTIYHPLNQYTWSWRRRPSTGRAGHAAQRVRDEAPRAGVCR